MRYLLVVLLVPASALGSTFTIGPLGINAIGLRGPSGELLDGTGVKIGHVESLRPSDPDEDTCDSPRLSDSGGRLNYAARTGAYSASN